LGSIADMKFQSFRSFDPPALACISERLVLTKRRKVAPDRCPPDGRQASVCVPLLNVSELPCVLFTTRTKTLSTHAGQVSFPGGHRDSGENETQAALRELREELGVSESSVRVLGLSHETLSITDVVVTPVVAFLGSFETLEHVMNSLIPNPSEVDEAFVLSIPELLEHSHEEVLKRKTYSVRTKRFTAGKAPIWGLTAFILDDLLSNVLVNCITKPSNHAHD
jgi:8-oxo-dGTP pyrophosphatase MutT (NUDIX family)